MSTQVVVPYIHWSYIDAGIVSGGGEEGVVGLSAWGGPHTLGLGGPGSNTALDPIALL